MAAQSESFARLPQYIGRNEAKNLLVQYAFQTIAHPECVALYFEGQGGLGKTHLLQQVPTILRQALPSEATPVCCPELIDFYKFENRDPLVIEQRLIQGLKQPSNTAELWHRLGSEKVVQAFEEHQVAYRRYEEAQESQNREAVESERAQLRAAFVAGWNQLSQQQPMIIAFDTLETLFFRAADTALINRIADPNIPSEISRQTAGVDLVIRWMERVLPQLRHTLVLLSGRPLREGNNTLVDRLRKLRLLRENVHQLKPFTDRADIQTYLNAYPGVQADSEERDLYYVQQITDGRPLLLTCYAETRRTDGALPSALPTNAPDMCRSRADFEDWLIATLLNPLAAAQDLRQQTLAYCLYFLVYARRGIRRNELEAIFKLEHIEYDSATLEQLDQVALVKQSGDTFFLHDEIFAMIDASRKPDAIGLRQPTLDYLCDVSMTAVQQATGQGATDELLATMANHMYYEMTRDIERGYFTYAIYIDRLLELGRLNAPLVLSDTFWRTLNYEVVIAGGSEYPYRDALELSQLSEERILRDEQVRYVTLLRTLSLHPQALAEARQLLQHYQAAGMLPSLEDHASASPSPAAAELYLFVTLGLKRIYAGITSRDENTQQMEVLGRTIINLLKDQAAYADRLLELRRYYFLGDSYNALSQLYSAQSRLDEALDTGRNAIRSLERYQRQVNQLRILNDDITAVLAQIRNNLAYAYTRRGDFDAARQLSLPLDELLRNPEMRHILPVRRRVLFFNTQALIDIERTDYLAAENPLAEAERLITDEELRDGRVRGLVRWARAQLQVAYMKKTRQPDLEIDQMYQEAYTRLENNLNQLPELLTRWAAYYRHLASLYASTGDTHNHTYYLKAADMKLDQALALPIDDYDIKRADLVGGKATIANMLGRHTDAIAHVQEAEDLLRRIPTQAYGQIISGRLALQHADMQIHQEAAYHEALEQLLIALARVYTFAEKHRDQETFEEVVHRFIADIPASVLSTHQEYIQGFQRTAEQLPYQIPDEFQWHGALQRSKRKLNHIIENHLLFAPDLF